MRVNPNFKLTIILFVGCFLSCTEDPAVSPQKSNGGNEEIAHSIVGEWQWVKTVMPFSQDTITPESEGYSIKRIFQANGTLKHYKNGALQYTTPYQLRYKKNDALNPQSDSSLMLHIDERSPAYYSIEKDTLTISRAYIDGSVKDYVRIKKDERH